MSLDYSIAMYAAYIFELFWVVEFFMMHRFMTAKLMQVLE